MSEAEIFGKLSRIFETHSLSNEVDKDKALDDLLEDFDQIDAYEGPETDISKQLSFSSPLSTTKNKSKLDGLSPNKPSPYDVWKQKNKKEPPKKAKRLNEQQWDTLVDKMHKSNRTKQNAMIKEQNHGLASELGEFQFKPRINQTSQELSATMKPLIYRVPEMIAEKQKFIENKKKENELIEVKDCTFAPKRFGAATSDMYLKKMGREKLTPDDLFRYEEERKRRNEMRRQIQAEMEEKDLTFKPRLGERSLKLQEKLLNSGLIDVDPLTRTTKSTVSLTLSPSKFRVTESSFIADDSYVEGPELVIESQHPYKHNTNEFTTVQIPGAVRYTIIFDERTKTEPIYDFIKFYDNETHTHYFGAGKYSGGHNHSSCNWPGVGGRPPLVIDSNKFIIHFKTNGSVNDWGFKLIITPLLSIDVNQSPNAGTTGRKHTSSFAEDPSSIPAISHTAKHYKKSGRLQQEPVHERLYQEALTKSTEFQNHQVEMLQRKLKNITLKPWETVKATNIDTSRSSQFLQMNRKTHQPKSTLSEIIDNMLVVPEGGSQDPIDALAVSTSTPISPIQHSQKHPIQTTPSTVASVPAQAWGKCVTIEYDDHFYKIWKQLKL